MKRIFFSLFFLPVLLAGCYDDKGNYDYKDIQSIEIEPFSSINKTVGDTIRIEPVFNVDVPADASYITYKWTVGGENGPNDPNWNSRNLFWIADKIISGGNVVLEVTDNRYGVTYMQRQGCNVTGEFDAQLSWVILSEDAGGRAMLSFFKTVEDDWTDDWSLNIIKATKVYKDLYPARNEGEELGRGALNLLEHYSDDYDAIGNYWVFTGSGAVDLEGVGLTKDVDLNQTFLGGVPAGVTIRGGVCMLWVDVLYDQSGHLYTRVKSDAELFNSEYFISEPVKYQGEVLEQCETVLGRYYKWASGYTPVIDRKHSRMLAVVDGGTSDFGEDELIDAAEVIAFPAVVEDAPDDYIPLHDFSGYEVVDMQYVLIEAGWDAKPGFVVLFKDGGDNLYLEEFVLERGKDVVHGNYLTVSGVTVYPLSGMGGVPSMMATPPKASYSFFASGKQLWMFDRDSKVLSLYKEFDAPITAMQGEANYGNHYIAVGLENGEFFVVTIVNAKNLPEDQRIMAELPPDVRLGKIVKINYKIGKGRSGWN